MALFDGKLIVLGVTGSIAAYKAADLASKLTQAGLPSRRRPVQPNAKPG